MGCVLMRVAEALREKIHRIPEAPRTPPARSAPQAQQQIFPSGEDVAKRQKGGGLRASEELRCAAYRQGVGGRNIAYQKRSNQGPKEARHRLRRARRDP